MHFIRGFLEQVDIQNWEARYTVPFKSSAAVRRLAMLADNLLLRYTFWKSCGEVGVQLPPLSDDAMKTRIPERPSKKVIPLNPLRFRIFGLETLVMVIWVPSCAGSRLEGGGAVSVTRG